MQFISRKYKQLRVVLDPKAAKEVEGRRMMVGLKGDFPIGKTVEFQNGVFVTDDPKVIKLLKSHDDYGVDFYALETDKKTGKPVAAKPSDEALRKLNEKKGLAQEVADTNPAAEGDQD